MAARYLKPQTPLEQGTDYVYPVTTLDQVIGSDGSTRLNTEVESIKSDIATIETSSTAANSYAIGQYLVYNNTLYKATKAITSGATLVVGNNIQATSVGTELKSLNDSITYIQNTQIPNVEQYLLKFEITTVTVGTTSYYTVNTGHLYLRAAFFLYDTNYNYAITQDKRGLNLSFQDATLFIFQTGTIPSSGSRAIRILYGYLDL